MSDLLSDFLHFLSHAPTSLHAVHEIGSRLGLLDFTPLTLQEPWKLKEKKRYFIHKNGACLAMVLPEKEVRKMTLVAAHTDSPCFKLKPNAFSLVQNMVVANVEPYGNPLISSWLNRDLCLAGNVVVLNSQGQKEEKCVYLDDALLVIPQLAPHLDRDLNEKGLLLNKHEHMLPLLGLGKEKISLENLLKRHLHFEKLLSFDLYLVPVEAPRFLGFSHEFLASYRLDNLASIHAALAALGSSKHSSPDTLKILYFSDHEEIGSSSSEGALSSFLTDTFTKIRSQLHISEEEWIHIKEHSLCLSVDMAHGLCPNYVAKYDKEHSPLLNQGIVFKHNANYKYASSAASLAPVIEACIQAKLPYQHFAARADIPCGSTIGPFLAQKTGMKVVDLGIAQLSMHSIREVIACQDYLELYLLLKHVFDII